MVATYIKRTYRVGQVKQGQYLNNWHSFYIQSTLSLQKDMYACPTYSTTPKTLLIVSSTPSPAGLPEHLFVPANI